jgi:hypothetical protein
MQKLVISANALAQFGHLSFGNALTFWLHIVFQCRLWIAVALPAAFALAKEAWFDPRYETETTRGSGIQDFAYYAVGIALGYLALRWHRYRKNGGMPLHVHLMWAGALLVLLPWGLACHIARTLKERL